MRIYWPGFFITEVIFLQMIVQHTGGGGQHCPPRRVKPASSLEEREQLRVLVSAERDWLSMCSHLNCSSVFVVLSNWLLRLFPRVAIQVDFITMDSCVRTTTCSGWFLWCTRNMLTLSDILTVQYVLSNCKGRKVDCSIYFLFLWLTTVIYF